MSVKINAPCKHIKIKYILSIDPVLNKYANDRLHRIVRFPLANVPNRWYDVEYLYGPGNQWVTSEGFCHQLCDCIYKKKLRNDIRVLTHCYSQMNFIWRMLYRRQIKKLIGFLTVAKPNTHVILNQIFCDHFREILLFHTNPKDDEKTPITLLLKQGHYDFKIFYAKDLKELLVDPHET